jgi:hypothetical protein
MNGKTFKAGKTVTMSIPHIKDLLRLQALNLSENFV